MNWSPRRLPKVRDQVVRLLSEPNSPLRAAMPNLVDQFDLLAGQLGGADLWWVAPDMAALAVSSAQTLPEVRWTAADRPSTVGMLVWDGGIGAVDYQGAEIPVDAVTWGPCPGGLWIWHWARRSRISEHLPAGAALDVPPLIPVAGDVMPVGADYYPADELGERVRTIATILTATWLLAQQPTLTERGRVHVDKATRRAYQRAGREDPEVTVVDLRRRYVPSDPDVEADESGRRFRHRWVVAGHWRDQPYGQGRQERRRIWIADHIKGPDGAPLMATTRVNVWRR